MACLQISRALAYLHSKDVLHGDLTCTNVLLSKDADSPWGFTAKVCGLGISPWDHREAAQLSMRAALLHLIANLANHFNLW